MNLRLRLVWGGAADSTGTRARRERKWRRRLLRREPVPATLQLPEEQAERGGNQIGGRELWRETRLTCASARRLCIGRKMWGEREAAGAAETLPTLSMWRN